VVALICIRKVAACALAVVAVLLPGCAGVSFKRSTETSGTFTSYGVAVTVLSTDFPKGALQIARENASDANLAHMEVKESVVIPYLGPVDWLLDILGIRYARISGTWGFAGT
jgi:hypothetical protein